MGRPSRLNASKKAVSKRISRSRKAAFSPVSSGFMIFFLVLSGLASIAALAIGVFWVLELNDINLTPTLAFVSIGPLVVGCLGLVLAYCGCFTVCHQHCRTHCVVVTLLLVCAVIILVAAGVFAGQYSELNMIAYTDSYRLPLSAQPTNDRTIAWYNKCCEMYNVIPAPFCGTVTTSDDPARECTPGTPYVSHRCGCYVDRERYEGFYNATSVDQCRRLAGISAYGTPLVGPPKQYSCGGVAFYTGSAVEYTGIAKRFQEQLFFNTSNVIFPTFIALFASSACFFLLVIVHLGFLIAAPFGYEEKEQPRATDEENPAQSTEAIEKPEAAGNEGEQAETEVDKAIGDKQESAGPGPAAAAQGGQDGPQSGPEDEANETGTDQSRAKDVAPASKETEEKVGNEGGGDTEEGATNRKDSEADTIHSMSDA